MRWQPAENESAFLVALQPARIVSMPDPTCPAPVHPTSRANRPAYLLPLQATRQHFVSPCMPLTCLYTSTPQPPLRSPCPDHSVGVVPAFTASRDLPSPALSCSNHHSRGSSLARLMPSHASALHIAPPAVTGTSDRSALHGRIGKAPAVRRPGQTLQVALAQL